MDAGGGLCEDVQFTLQPLLLKCRNIINQGDMAINYIMACINARVYNEFWLSLVNSNISDLIS